ncbi:MAG TPA: carboxypeptidase-like regulatory domain-containing protein, partial [Pyrinomonadaceae bacterium]|nr:carboxypeptidase-like regulatory domain-containing protein [Pyrinomonadaceae bacterium]
MRAIPRRLCPSALRFALVCVFALTLAAVAFGQAQSNASDLQGYVRDPQGGLVPNATVTARNKATSLTRTGQTNDEGYYQITNLPPGDYEVTVEATNFSRASVPSVVLTVGQRADLDVPLQAGQVSETVTVSGATTDVVETSRTAVANTIDQQRIENLPINQRDYINFSLTTSTVTRDNGRPIGPAPTSGLNFGGQRGRSNLVQVDGADNTDNSVNAARSTVSQEAVQEFQVVTNSYAPEFGRTSGGVVNVVTKGGTNDVRGNLFGFIRHKSFQSRNAFAPIIDNDPNKKPPFTRGQYGATLGGPLDRDRTFFFAAFEQRRRQESGFFTSNVSAGLNSSATIPAIPELGLLFPAA